MQVKHVRSAAIQVYSVNGCNGAVHKGSAFGLLSYKT